MPSEKTPSKDEALEAMDFIVNILKEHEKDLDRLIGELGTVTEQFGETGDLGEKVKKIETKIDSLQTDIASLVERVSTSQAEAQVGTATSSRTMGTQTTHAAAANEIPVLMQCRNWEDFQAMASGTQTLSFAFRENDLTFVVNAVKNNRVITFNGKLPKPSSLLKMWLSKQLDVSEKKILEGELTLG